MAHRFKVYRGKETRLKAIELKVLETDIARDKQTKQLVCRVDDEQYDPALHELVPFNYRTTLRDIIRQPMGEGATSDQLDSALTILRKLKKLQDGEILRVDNDDFAYLETKIKSVKWAMNEEWIAQFRDDLLHPVDIPAEQIEAALDAHQADQPAWNGKSKVKQVARR